MADVVDSMEDWSLQAIVRQSSGDHLTKILHMDEEDQSVDHGFRSSYPEFFHMSIGSYSDELEKLYKPFYPAGICHPLPNSTQKSGSEFQENRPRDDDDAVEDKQADHDQSDRSSGTGEFVAKVDGGAYTPKYKRRKNQQKRVMIQVSADGLGSDLWAWRKYGQKPIKGSPYPRSYYRCSSSKGCLARKQVEQSCSDPGMFIITYTAEHSHSQPTRRNSLAGTVRQKFPNPKSPNHTPKLDANIATTLVSPKPLDDLQASSSIKQEMKEENDQILPISSDGGFDDDYNQFDISDSMFNDDFFSGLDFLDGLDCHARTSCR
ncbi:WRKY transcription factor 22-like [Henckelia pumila]|uniref:WRKY transcription factor 22-like n=1 Tax=Henckelia pumila TaxID=405737 RepID=UPI003C6DFEF6